MAALVVVTAGVAFYAGWWLAHEHYEALGPAHEHVLAPHYWKLAVPLALLWLALAAGRALAARPVVLVLAAAGATLLCAARMPHHPGGAPPALGLAVGGAALLLGLATAPLAQIARRAGRVPRARPRSEAAIARAARAGLAPVARGWSFWLRGDRAPPRVLVLEGNWAGARWVSEAEVRVRAGTTFGELEAALAREGRTLEDRSQFDGLSVGGAVRTQAHGWSARTTFLLAVTELVAVRLGTGERRAARAAREPIAFRALALDPAWVLVYVTLRTVEDRAVDVARARDPPDLAARWADPAVTHRMLLANRHGVTLTLATDARRQGRDECRDAAGEAAAAAWRRPLAVQRPGGGRPPRPWTTRRHHLAFLLGLGRDAAATRPLSATHALFGALWPLEMHAMRLLRYRNAELFTADPVDVGRLAPALAALHRAVGGHTELRQTREVLAIDLALPRGAAALPRVLALLHAHGVREARLHPGKWEPPSLAPLRRRADAVSVARAPPAERV